MCYQIQATTAVTLGIIWGLFIATTAVMLSDGGNGWNSAMPYGIVAIIMAPYAFITWAKQDTININTVIMALIVAVIANISLYQTAHNEGLEYFYNTIRHSLPWLLLWTSWQILLLITFINKRKAINI